MTDYVALVRFDNNDTTYRVFSDIASSAVGSLVVASAIVEREADGRLTVPHGGSAEEGSGTVTGGLIGALVGILGGPLGVLLGWGTGALIGAATDADHGDNDESIVGVISRGIEPGRNAIVLQTAEETFDDLDAFVARNGGVIVRDTLANVQAEVDAEEQALKDAQKAAKEELKAKRKAEREAKHAGH